MRIHIYNISSICCCTGHWYSARGLRRLKLPLPQSPPPPFSWDAACALRRRRTFHTHLAQKKSFHFRYIYKTNVHNSFVLGFRGRICTVRHDIFARRALYFIYNKSLVVGVAPMCALQSVGVCVQCLFDFQRLIRDGRIRMRADEARCQLLWENK